MMFFHTLSVRAKLTCAFACVLVTMLALAGFSGWQLSKVFERTDEIMKYRLTGIRDSGHMLEWVPRLRTREMALVTAAPDKVDAIAERVKASQDEFAKYSKVYAEAIATPEERALFDAAQAAWDAYIAIDAPLIAAAKAGRLDEAKQIVDGSGKAFETALNAVRALGEYNDRLSQEDAAAAKAAYEGSLRGMALLIVIAAGIATALGLLLTRAIAVPLRDAVDLAKAVADGDLSRSATTSSAAGRDEVGQLSVALGQMVGQLRNVVGDVRKGVDAVSHASSEIATGNLDLSQRTEEQASNLQQTAASMEQLTATVRHNADNARAASQFAEQATQVAAKGGDVVAGVVSTMNGITESSRRIADIVGTIDGIAFQTNILALNAAVEAARAGEQGRGFAVVAGEVRTLAQRSAQSAKEIKALIETSVSSVADGSRQVEDAGATMQEIIQQVRRVGDLVSEITAATVEQSQGIDQVGQAVSQLDQVTQQNAALVEESAAAAESLKHQAQSLSQAMSVFRLGS